MKRTLGLGVKTGLGALALGLGLVVTSRLLSQGKGEAARVFEKLFQSTIFNAFDDQMQAGRFPIILDFYGFG